MILSDGDVVFQLRKAERRQGQYARDAKAHPPADLAIERIGELVSHDFSALLPLEVSR